MLARSVSALVAFLVLVAPLHGQLLPADGELARMLRAGGYVIVIPWCHGCGHG